MIMRAITLTIVSAAFLVLSVVAGVMGTWIADREPPIEITKTKVLTPLVAPGGMLRVEFATDRKRRSCYAYVDRSLRDARNERAQLPDDEQKPGSQPGGLDTFSMSIVIPRDFAPGPARYIFTAEFVCNPVHRIWPIPFGTRTIDFTVAP